MESKYDVIFGTGPLGLAVMNELKKSRRNFILVNRSGKAPIPNVAVEKCDALNKQDVVKVCQNASSIYHCIGLPYKEWKDKLPIIMDNIMESASKVEAKIVYADNLYAYGPQKQPFHEKLTYNPIGEKTRVRAEVSTMLMKAHEAGKVIATIGRGSDFYGPRVRNSILGERVFKHLIEGKKVELIGDLKVRHSHIFIEDFAKGLVKLCNEPQADGEVWHLPHVEAKSNQEIVNMIANKLSVKPKYRIANKLIVNVGAIFNPFMKDMKELIYQHQYDFIVDSTKYEKIFGSHSHSFTDGIEKTIKWYKDNN